MKSIKQIIAENRQYYVFNDMNKSKNGDQNFLSIDNISFKSTDAAIYKIRYITIKGLEHVNVDSENRLYLI